LFDLDQARKIASVRPAIWTPHGRVGILGRQLEGGLDMDERAKAPTKAQELRAFLFLSVVLAPVLAVGLVSGYGFLVWAVQLVTGPPGAKF
jgi:nitrate reductase NapE